VEGRLCRRVPEGKGDVSQEPAATITFRMVIGICRPADPSWG
jgi:hypothetical protein